jgi:diaminohydroxyphosphoribosylaminopyrimidine deaminase/5-amino-6-(5-phosphoribosylamino)uracil reductase
MRLVAEAGFTRIMSEGGPRLGEALALAGLADEVTIVTSVQPLGHEGLLAVRPGLAGLLVDPARFAPTGSLDFGPDRWDSFERVG